MIARWLAQDLFAVLVHQDVKLAGEVLWVVAVERAPAIERIVD